MRFGICEEGLHEYDYLTFDAAVDEAIADHRWTFTEAGDRFG